MTELKKYIGLGCLLAMVLLTPMVVYRMAVKSTVELKESIEEQRVQIEKLRSQNNTPYARDINRDRTIESSELVALIQNCTQHNGVSIHKYTPYVTARELRAEILTSEFILQGGFIPTVRVLYFLERSIVGCKVISVSFNAKTDRVTQKTELITTILIQQINQQL